MATREAKSRSVRKSNRQLQPPSTTLAPSQDPRISGKHMTRSLQVQDRCLSRRHAIAPDGWRIESGQKHFQWGISYWYYRVNFPHNTTLSSGVDNSDKNTINKKSEPITLLRDECLPYVQVFGMYFPGSGPCDFHLHMLDMCQLLQTMPFSHHLFMFNIVFAKIHRNEAEYGQVPNAAFPKACRQC